MFAGRTAIDMSAFVADPHAPPIYDAANEALLQNPYITDMAPIIGMRDNVLYVQYEMTPEERAATAERIHREVQKVTKSIIKPGMSDRAKALAINEYVATTAVYDDAALEFAKGEHEFEEYLQRFPNAWDAEGVLLDGTGLCSSYAAAYKALADEAGLTTVRVTGYADDTDVAHEWIKAKIGGRWQIIDPTWNSNIWEQIRGDIETYFGLTDSQGNRMQFDVFAVDSFIPTFDTH
jgi:hypothetical protein